MVTVEVTGYGNSESDRLWWQVLVIYRGEWRWSSCTMVRECPTLLLPPLPPPAAAPADQLWRHGFRGIAPPPSPPPPLPPSTPGARPQRWRLLGVTWLCPRWRQQGHACQEAEVVALGGPQVTLDARVLTDLWPRSACWPVRRPRMPVLLYVRFIIFLLFIFVLYLYFVLFFIFVFFLWCFIVKFYVPLFVCIFFYIIGFYNLFILYFFTVIVCFFLHFFVLFVLAFVQSILFQYFSYIWKVILCPAFFPFPSVLDALFYYYYYFRTDYSACKVSII